MHLSFKVKIKLAWRSFTPSARKPLNTYSFDLPELLPISLRKKKPMPCGNVRLAQYFHYFSSLVSVHIRFVSYVIWYFGAAVSVTICVRALCFPCNLPHVLSKWRSHSCSDCNHSMANMVRALLWITRVSRQSRRLQEPSAVVKEQHYMNDYSHCNLQQVCVFKFVVHLAFVCVFLSVDIELSNHYIWPLWGPILNTALLFLIVRTWQQSKTEKRLNNTKYQQLSITSFASWGKSCFLSTVTDREKTKKKKWIFETCLQLNLFWSNSWITVNRALTYFFGFQSLRLVQVSSASHREASCFREAPSSLSLSHTHSLFCSQRFDVTAREADATKEFLESNLVSVFAAAEVLPKQAPQLIWSKQDREADTSLPVKTEERSL